MSLKEETLPMLFLRPGEFFFGETPTLVTTVLGSCISVTMYVPALGIGSICHGLLPTCKGRKQRQCNCGDRCPEGFRFVECSIWRMLEEYMQRGISPKGLQVKLFGGADMFPASEPQRCGKTIGHQNISVALEVIEGEGLVLAAADVGGSRGRKIMFNTATGEVLLKRLNSEREFKELHYGDKPVIQRKRQRS